MARIKLPYELDASDVVTTINGEEKTQQEFNEQIANNGSGLSAAEKNWVKTQVEGALKTEAAQCLTVTTSTGTTYYADTTTAASRTRTISVSLSWKEGDAEAVSVAADSTPTGWTKDGNSYKYALNDTTRSVAATTFNYTIPASNAKYGGITVSKASTARSISVVNPAWIGLYESNDAANVAAAVAAINASGRKTANVNEKMTLTNSENKTKWLWIVTKTSASATQLGQSVLNAAADAINFVSPNNANITLSGYKVYISKSSVDNGESFADTQVSITL